MKHPAEEELLLHAYGESPSTGDHLASCPPCRGRLHALRAFLDGVSRAEAPPERDDDYGRRVWNRVRPRLPKGRARSFSLPPWLLGPRLATAGVFALVVAAFVLGRSSARRVPIPEEARERILKVAVGEHLERSENVLVDLVNAPSAPRARERADELVRASRLLRQSARQSGDEALVEVLEDLERLLLEIARLDGPLTETERDRFRARIDRTGVLFKARVLGTRLDREEESASRRAASRL